MFKKSAIAATLALAVGSAAAAPLVFDPTGAGGSTGSYVVTGLDWDPSSVLAINGNQAIANFINQAGSTSFQVLSHATLTGGALNGGSVFSTTGADYEITAVIGFHERVISAVPGDGLTTAGTAGFQFDNTQPTFVRLYYGTGATKDANQLAGTGFNNGTLIFSSTLTTPNGGFATSIGPVVDLLDKTPNGDNWNGQKTVEGNGFNAPLTINAAAPTFIDTNFFQNTPLLSFIFQNLSLNVPFTNADPSYAFTLGNNTLYNVTTDAGLTSTLGQVNGGLDCVTNAPRCVASGADFIFATDVNSSITATVPEPGSLALVGLALAGLGLRARRRRD